MAVMSTDIWRILPALMLGGSFGIARAQPVQVSIVGIPVVTVCEALQDLSGYNGKSIIVVGRIGYTREGTWLSEDCERTVVTKGYAWANIISSEHNRSQATGKLPPELPKGFDWDKELLTNKLKEVQATTKLHDLKEYKYSGQWVAIFGRFETQLPLRVGRGGDGKLMGYGFGHLGMAPAQLISSKEGFYELE